MPSNCCCVPKCNRRGGHLFPVDKSRKKRWLAAIRRDVWKPSKYSTVCQAHFRREDYVQHVDKRKLRSDAVPSIFSWSKEVSACVMSRRQRSERRQETDQRFYFPDELCVDAEIEVTTEADSTCDNLMDQNDVTVRPTVDHQTQTEKLQNFTIKNFIFNDKAVMYYTGLESYSKFLLVLSSLGPAAFNLNYRYAGCKQLCIEDQLFLSLIKLRRYRPNFELSLMFSVSVATVSNIYLTWWNFMSRQWKELNIWPSRQLTTFYMPEDFRRKFPKTRVTLDGLECPVKRPKHPVTQQRTFSTYKNRHTVKCILGVTPGGLVSHIPDCYGGSASDRQLIERDCLTMKCDPKDTIMADKGFNVQDIFAPYDIGVNVPEFFRKKNRMSNKTVLNDRKIASKRVHVERLIGLGKTYTILKEPLNDSETKLASEIVYICCMLCNFRSAIVPRTS